MLTPAFELQQDSSFIIIIIKARYAKVSETEIFVDGGDFKFHSKPYFLRLNLPGRLIEDGREKASYDVDAGIFTIRIPKECEGEDFLGLDLLTKLLAPSGQTSAKEPCIEVLDNNDEKGHVTGEEDFDWQVDQQPYFGDEEKEKMNGHVSYGFANRRSGVFKRLRDEICGVVDIEEADFISLPERKRARIMAEKEKFDDSHYLADLYQDDAIQPLLEFKPLWVHNYKKMREKMVLAGKAASSQDFTYTVNFTEDEKELMMKLPHKEFILSKLEVDGALLGVADILFAYAYNVRSNEGEYSVESAWTVCKLSSTLSCLDWFQTTREMTIACCRRALCYPLYRSWALCHKLLKDVRMILRLGRNQVLKCFFEIHKLLSNDEPRYILNDLYISDYCVWLQSISNERFSDLEQQIGEVKLEKKDIGLDLDDLEEAASIVENEELRQNGSEQKGHQKPGPLDGPPQEQSQEEHSMESEHKVIHQVGYPDLILRDTPVPDVVTAHIVKAKEMVPMGRDDAAVVDSDDGDDPAPDQSIVEEGNGGASCTIPQSFSGSVRDASTDNHCTLENDFVNKVMISSMDNSDSRLGEGVLSSVNKSDLPNNDSGLKILQIRRKDGEVNDGYVESGREDEVEVVETMHDMLNHLSLDPHIPSSSSGLKKLSSTKDDFPEWAETPPTKLVETFEDK
ncbi:protein SHQ1 homolog [Lytechinus pictus]|uniref:protein SHQ1 homolog n=1 Tax=Lytechinus pictus TaxID=7653 RepID=UPI0030B9B6A5